MRLRVQTKPAETKTDVKYGHADVNNTKLILYLGSYLPFSRPENVGIVHLISKCCYLKGLFNIKQLINIARRQQTVHVSVKEREIWDELAAPTCSWRDNVRVHSVTDRGKYLPPLRYCSLRGNIQGK